MSLDCNSKLFKIEFKPFDNFKSDFHDFAVQFENIKHVKLLAKMFTITFFVYFENIW